MVNIKDKDLKIEHRNKRIVKVRRKKHDLYIPSLSWNIVKLLPVSSPKTFLLFAGICTAHKLKRDNSEYQKIPSYIADIINLNSHSKTKCEKHLIELGFIDVKNELGKKTCYKLLQRI